MSFIRLNGWRLPAQEKSSQTQAIKMIGSIAANLKNKPKNNRRAIARSWDISTTLQEKYAADTLEGLFEGSAHHFPFIENAWSESGIGPEVGADFSIQDYGGPYSTRGHYLLAGVGGLIFNVGVIDKSAASGNGRWTAIYWLQDETVNGISRWRRHCVRSDNSNFVNGKPAFTSGLSISQGAAVIDASAKIADLTIYPFYACRDFIEQDFEWASGLNAEARWSFDEDFSEDVQGPEGVANDVSFKSGIAGRAAYFNGATAYFQAPSTSLVRAAVGYSEISFSFWARQESFGTSSRFVFYSFEAGVNNAFTLSTSQNGNLVFSLRASGQYAWVAAPDGSLPLDKWQQIMITANLVSGDLKIYSQGVLIASKNTSFTTTVFSAIVTDSFFIGSKDAVNTQRFHGRLAEFKIWQKEVNAERTIEIYECEKWGRRFPLPRLSSSMPRLDVWGDFDGCKGPLEVLGAVSSSSVGDYSDDKNGEWITDGRETNGSIDEVKTPDVFVPDSDIGFTFNFKDFRGVDLYPDRGSIVASPSPFATRNHYKGPYNWLSSALYFDGASKFSIPDNSLAFFGGAESITMAAWVRTSTASKRIFEVNITSGGRKLLFYISTGGNILGSCRPLVSETFITGTKSITDLKWHHVLIEFDFPAGTAAILIDGKLDVKNTGINYGTEKTDSDFAKNGFIGGYLSGGEFVGYMASFRLWRRQLRESEKRKLFNAGKSGIF